MLKHCLKYFLFFLFFILLNYFSEIQARWATPEEASVELEFYNRDIKVFADGRVEEIIEQKVKILNEKGREMWGTLPLHYNSDTETIEIIEAKTIHSDKEDIITSNMIENKPLASSSEGFDQLSQILLCYPHSGVGSSIYLKYKLTTLKQPLPGYFATSFFYGMEGYWKKSHINLQSEIPLYMKVNDPYHRLEIKEDRKQKIHTISITLKEPIFCSLINEGVNNQLEEKFLTKVQVSSFNHIDDMAKAFSKDYAKVLNGPLPAFLNSIRDVAATFSNEVEQINTVTSLLSNKIRYMGDWRSIAGKFLPRSFEEVIKSSVGDCKDFSSMTAAILKTLGYKAQIAFIRREIGYLPPKKLWPDLREFNHAIVKITSQKGQVYWIDPTNFASMADGIFPDIANRPVMVINFDQTSCEMVPEIKADHAKKGIESVTIFKNPHKLSVEGTIKLIGEEALIITGSALIHSLQSIEEGIIYSLSNGTNFNKKKVSFSENLMSRIVKNLEFKYYYEQENSTLLTNKGIGLSLSSKWVNPFLETLGDQVGVTYIRPPITLNNKMIYKNVIAENLNNLNCYLDSPWVKAKRECYILNGDIVIEENISLLKSFVFPEEISSPTYKEFINDLRKYFVNAAIIFSQ